MSLDLGLPVGDLARHLIDIPSPSGSEGDLADLVEDALRSLAHLEVLRNGNAIVARTTLGRDTRVAIAGHLDTVPPAGNLPARVEDGVLWGRGAVDMKGGLAVMLSLAAEVTHPARDVTWVFYDQEEVAADRSGLGRLMREHPDLFEVDFAVLGEPTSGGIEGGCNGTIRVDLLVPGRAAHSARAWRGTNAIHAAAPLLAALAAYEPATVEVDGLEYREGLNAVAIHAGIAGNIIPDACVVTVNYRFAPHMTSDQAVAVVEALARDTGIEGLVLEVADRAEGCRPGLGTPMAWGLREAAIATGAGEPRAKVGWTDVARFGALGIPAVNYGPGDPERAHADDERVDLAEIDQVRRGLGAWLAS